MGRARRKREPFGPRADPWADPVSADVADAADLAVGQGAVATPSAAQELRASATAWDAFVTGSPEGFHTQLSAWSTVKAANGWRGARVVADGGNGPIGAQVLVRKLGPGPFGVGYAPRGPIASTWDEAGVAAF